MATYAPWHVPLACLCVSRRPQEWEVDMGRYASPVHHHAVRHSFKEMSNPLSLPPSPFYNLHSNSHPGRPVFAWIVQTPRAARPPAVRARRRARQQ